MTVLRASSPTKSHKTSGAGAEGSLEGGAGDQGGGYGPAPVGHGRKSEAPPEDSFVSGRKAGEIVAVWHVMGVMGVMGVMV
eukprot:1242794-Rhodomonas_salina.1